MTCMRATYNTQASQAMAMAAVDLMDLVEQRMKDMGEEEGVEAEATFFMSDSGPWSFMIVRDDDEVIGFEFIETENSWRRPEVIEEYNAAADSDLEVLVVVPDEVLIEATKMIYQSGGVGITISSYHAMELSPRPLAS
jgi:hypothetical protein